eukprot:2484699-Pyramimonas_sp.AAC.1
MDEGPALPASAPVRPVRPVSAPASSLRLASGRRPVTARPSRLRTPTHESRHQPSTCDDDTLGHKYRYFFNEYATEPSPTYFLFVDVNKGFPCE